MIRLAAILFFLCAAASKMPLAAQETIEPNSPSNGFDYAGLMEKAEQELHWSRIYRDSFDRTKEFSYLRLSAQHGLNAVQSYYRIQKQMERISAFTYKTRKKRLEACRYFESLVRESLHYDEENHLQGADPKYCRTRVK